MAHVALWELTLVYISALKPHMSACSTRCLLFPSSLGILCAEIPFPFSGLLLTFHVFAWMSSFQCSSPWPLYLLFAHRPSSILYGVICISSLSHFSVCGLLLFEWLPYIVVCSCHCVVLLPSHVQLVVTPWMSAHQASLSLTVWQSLPKFMFIASVMLSSHLILWCPPFLLPSIFPSIRDFSIESLFASDDQNTGASASASLLPVNIQDFSPLRLTGLTSLLPKGLRLYYVNKLQFIFTFYYCCTFLLFQV